MPPCAPRHDRMAQPDGYRCENRREPPSCLWIRVKVSRAFGYCFLFFYVMVAEERGFRMRTVSVLCAVVLTCGLAAAAGAPAVAATACSNPDAIGTSRTIVVDPTEHPFVGTMQYHETLPLRDHEIVLTFDDGPLPPWTTEILHTLESQCAKAVFFEVGVMAHSFPKWTKMVAAAGETIGTHSLTHPFTFYKMNVEQAAHQINGGIAAVKAALGHDPAPFFRVPGLLRSKTVEDYLVSQHLMTWSADFVADDWKHIGPDEIIKRALQRIEARGRGILLLHDIHPTTAKALPVLLADLKERGYHLVQVLPVAPGRPATPTMPWQWEMHPHPPPPPPVVVAAGSVPGLPSAIERTGTNTASAPQIVIPLREHSRHRGASLRRERRLWRLSKIRAAKSTEAAHSQLPIAGASVFAAPTFGPAAPQSQAVHPAASPVKPAREQHSGDHHAGRHHNAAADIVKSEAEAERAQVGEIPPSPVAATGPHRTAAAARPNGKPHHKSLLLGFFSQFHQAIP